MKLSNIQKLALLMDGRIADNQYIVNKREEGQPRFFKCTCCGETTDFEDSDDYIGAVNQWVAHGEKCYMCWKGFCHCKEKEEQNAIS